MNMQKGFSLVEGLLIVVVISIVGLGGWYVAGQQDNEDGPANNIVSVEDENNEELATEESVVSGLPYVCDYSGLTEVVDNGIEKNSNNDVIISSKSGLNKVRSVPDRDHPYTNVEQLYINDALALDNVREQYGGGGLFPLFWSEDETTLYLRTRDVVNHGEQDSFELYQFDTKDQEFTSLNTLPGAAVDYFVICNTETPSIIVAHGIGGGFGSYQPPHKISSINLDNGNITELLSINKQSPSSFDEIGFMPETNSVSYTIKEYTVEEGTTLYYDSDLEMFDSKEVSGVVGL
jgi:hypothetical protein